MSGKNTIKMLSIDDKTLTTDLDRAGYRKMGVYVRPAANYEEAARTLRAEKIDLVVINADYKPIDANQITKHLKMQDEFKAIPVVITSVQTTAKVRNSALEAGADLFVEQPLPRQYFIEKLKQLLEHKTRTTERVAVHGNVTFAIGKSTETCAIGDLSVSGMLLSTEATIADGTTITLEFELPGNKKPIKVDGVVVRTIKYSANHPDRQTGVGVRFDDFHGDSKKRLEKYIEKSSHDDSRLRYYL
jgi:DNA-binding response OmpR family regulator